MTTHYVFTEPRGPKVLRLRRVTLIPQGFPPSAADNLPHWWAIGDRRAIRLGDALIRRLAIERARRAEQRRQAGI